MKGSRKGLTKGPPNYLIIEFKVVKKRLFIAQTVVELQMVMHFVFDIFLHREEIVLWKIFESVLKIVIF